MNIDQETIEKMFKEDASRTISIEMKTLTLFLALMINSQNEDELQKSLMKLLDSIFSSQNHEKQGCHREIGC